MDGVVVKGAERIHGGYDAVRVGGSSGLQRGLDVVVGGCRDRIRVRSRRWITHN